MTEFQLHRQQPTLGRIAWDEIPVDSVVVYYDSTARSYGGVRPAYRTGWKCTNGRAFDVPDGRGGNPITDEYGKWAGDGHRYVPYAVYLPSGEVRSFEAERLPVRIRDYVDRLLAGVDAGDFGVDDLNAYLAQRGACQRLTSAKG